MVRGGSYYHKIKDEMKKDSHVASLLPLLALKCKIKVTELGLAQW